MITADQFHEFYNELIEQGILCDKNDVLRPPLILDRQTYSDLHKAIVEWMESFWRILRPTEFKPLQSKICGFDILIKEDLHAPNL